MKWMRCSPSDVSNIDRFQSAFLCKVSWKLISIYLWDRTPFDVRLSQISFQCELLQVLVVYNSKLVAQSLQHTARSFIDTCLMSIRFITQAYMLNVGYVLYTNFLLLLISSSFFIKRTTRHCSYCVRLTAYSLCKQTTVFIVYIDEIPFESDLGDQ